MKIEPLPKSLYKYYRFDEMYNRSRLFGDVYLASPLDFNDVFDCQLILKNNTLEMLDKKAEPDKWLDAKLEELGYIVENRSAVANDLKLENSTVLFAVQKRQLERLGILCLTQSNSKDLMWSYYTNHEGFCIEYHTECLVQNLVIACINALDYKITRFLFETKNYKSDPEARTSAIDSQIKQYLPTCEQILDRLSNNYLSDKDAATVTNFVHNFLIKRFGCSKIKYENEIVSNLGCRNSDSSTPKLFFDDDETCIKRKYYTKNLYWSHEDEFRLIISLGGRKVLRLKEDAIKSITFGLNSSIKQIFEILHYLRKDLSEDDLSGLKLYKMVKQGDDIIPKELSQEIIFDIQNNYELRLSSEFGL